MKVKQSYKFLFWFIVLLIILFNLRQVIFPLSGELSSPLIINEFMAANRSGLFDEDGEYSDWIELYNQSNQPVNLAGWSLSDDPNQPEKWIFPEITLPGHEYLIVFASGKDRKPSESKAALHTNFRLDKERGVLALYNPTARRFSDTVEVTYPQQFSDISYGRLNDGAAYGYYAHPTPGMPNDDQRVWTDIATEVTYRPTRGFYATPFTAVLSTTTPGTTIRYTLDGSEPTETNGLKYTAPITIESTTYVRAAAFKPGFLPSPSTTHSYIFLADVLSQPPDPPPFPTEWGVYQDDTGEHSKGSAVPADFEMDPEIINHPDYQPLISAALTAIPSLSLVTEASNFDIYTHPTERGVEWERPVSVELIYPEEGGVGFQTNAGLRIQGGKGRGEEMPKHSFRLLFKDDYGPTKLNFPIFPDSPVETFDTLILRGGVNGSFAGTDQELSTYTRDEWLRASQIEMSGVGSHGLFVHLYLNGLYWGLYNIVERPDASFAASYYGGEKEDWHVRNHTGPLSGTGEQTEYARYDFIKAESIEEKYAAIESYIDYAQFSDYVILNWYAGNIDWARKNFYYAIQNPTGRVKYFAWDGEKIWLDGAKLYFADRPEDFGVEPFFATLMWDPEFNMLFADRMYKHLFNDGPLTDKNAMARWNEINAVIDLAIIGESARWGDAKREVPYTRKDWRNLMQEVLAQMEGNTAKLITLAREAGYYPPIDPPEFNRYGGTVPAGFELSMAAPSGTIYYTLDGTDPRMSGGNVSAGAIAYHSPITLTENTQVKARTLLATERVWSALNEAEFFIEEPRRSLVISELMYNPPGGDDYEFVELKNIGDSEINLSNMVFSGIGYMFPNGTTLAPGQYFVLVRDEEKFAEQYPNVPVAGTYTKSLSNKGETLALKNPLGEVLFTVTYDDENGWPLSPDGRGDSLILTNPTGDLNNPRNWQASNQVNGSPGRE